MPLVNEGKAMASKKVTIKLPVNLAKELYLSIDGWMDAGSLPDNDRDDGIVGDELKALEETMNQLRSQIYGK